MSLNDFTLLIHKITIQNRKTLFYSEKVKCLKFELKCKNKH